MSNFIRKLISPILAIVNKIKRSRLRQIMRGYRKLKQAGQLDRISLLKQSLTEQPLNLTNKHFSSFVMGAGYLCGEIVVRQDLLCRVGGQRLNRALLSASGKVHGSVVLPLPKEWRKVLTQHNFKVANFRSALLWQLYVFSLLLYGVASIGKVLFAGIFSKKNKCLKQRRYVYFADLSPGNLPKIVDGCHSFDVISWYLQWAGKTEKIEAIHHSVNNALPIILGDVSITPQHHALPGLAGSKSIIKYAIWGGWATAIAGLDFLRGRWWHSLSLSQAALAAQVRSLPLDSLAREYLFHNSGWIYRPLWTYEAERLGSVITFYFYSTNSEFFKKSCGYPPVAYGWKAMNWPHYLVWDEYQANFVRRAVGVNANISVVGSIWFQSNAIMMPKIPKQSVAVFDVTPYRDSLYQTFGLDNEFYTPTVVKPFLQHVFNATQKYNFDMLWKRKRNVGRIAHPHYRHLANQLSRSSHVILVEPEISAIRVIESSVAVISLPFTSTAIIAKEMGKPSIYYDPTGLLHKDDRAAHGITIISTRDELDNWLSFQKSTISV